MIRRPLAALWLVVVWVALWGEVTIANVLAGVAVAAVALAVTRPHDADERVRFRLIPALRFAAWFLWKLVEASAIVAWEVATPRNRINEGVVAVPLVGASPTVTTIVANAITLTPGTMTLEVRHVRAPVLYVHVLHLREIEEVRAEVRHLQRLVTLAFGSDRAVAALNPSDQEEVPS